LKPAGHAELPSTKVAERKRFSDNSRQIQAPSAIAQLFADPFYVDKPEPGRA
jgi:hypothetical protein